MVWEVSDDIVAFGDPVLLWKIVDPLLRVVAIGLEMALVVEEKVRADGDARLSVAEGIEVEIVGMADSLLVMKRVEFSPKVVGICSEAGSEEEWMELDEDNALGSLVVLGASDESVLLEE